MTPVTAMHAIDWAGSPSHPGTGALLMLQAFATSETQYAVDGTEQARALFPKLCFEDKPKLTILRKMLTPFHRLRTADQRLLRKWAGTAKDTATVWRTRTPEVPHTVELRSVAAFDPEVDCLQRRPSARVVTCLRDHSLLNYFLRCPLPGFSGWTIHTSKRVIGFALLKVTPQGRIQRGKIVDCWLDTDDLGCWQAAMVALIDHLRALSADDVLCYATTPSLHAALLWSGFTKLREQNVYIRDKEQSLPLDVPFGFSMLDGDRAFL